MRNTCRAVLITAAALLVVMLMQIGIADEFGRRYTESGLKRALLTYGVSRGLNGIISVAQGTEVAVEPAGVGITFTPGEILDPVNDLIERFSWIVLASSTSFGIQRVLLSMTAYPWFSLLVSVFTVLSALLAWLPKLMPARGRGLLLSLSIVLVTVRFLTPAIAIASDGIYRVFLEPQYTESKRRLEATAGSIQAINEQAQRQSAAPPADESWWDSAKRTLDSARTAVDVQDRLEALKRAAADLSEQAVNLIVVFVLETLLFPLLFLWLGIQIMKASFRLRLDD